MKSRKSLEEDVMFTDICSTSDKKVQYLKVKDELNTVKVATINNCPWDFFKSLKSFLKDVFLPKGYPHSVSTDYLEYQIWDTCQAFCSSISGTLTVKAIMQGIGVGSEAASPVSAAISWIFKDGTGMIGSILFAWLKGSKLDSDCKKWRLFADILNDVAMLIELYIPHLIEYSTQMLCIATVFKALVGTAGGSTRAALITHQAIKENIADVSAKDSSQEIFTNLCAFLLGVFILNHVTETREIWAVMCTATLFHLLFNYKAVRCLKINVFNGERFRLGLRTYLPTSSVPTVEQVNRKESVFLILGMSDFQLCGFSIVFGRSLENVLSHRVTVNQLAALTSFFQDKRYFILVDNKEKKLYVTFRQTFTDNDVLKAYFHASLLGVALTFLKSSKKLDVVCRSRKNSPMSRLKNILHELKSESGNSIADPEDTILLKAYVACDELVEKEFAEFCSACTELGWNINKHLIIIDDWRGDWKHAEEKKEVIQRKLTQVDSKKKSEHHRIEKRKSTPVNHWNNLIIS